MTRPPFHCVRVRSAPVLAALLTAMFLLPGAPGASAQQTGSVTGVVRNATTTEPIIGAQVVIEGLGRGAPTNNEGRYLILNVPAGEHTVRVEYIGYGIEEQPVRVPAGGTATVDFGLRSEAISLEGVVVTGTAGRARRREVGNSISQINAQDIQVAAIADVGDVIQGRATGVQISDNTGQVGGGSTIRLRGNNSINMGNDPLIYIDGVRMESNPTGSDGEVGQSPIALDLVNPNDIERIEIIKGPAATTLFGTEASGGVIQVFTKRGAAGAPQFTLSIDQGFHDMPHVGPDAEVNPTGLNLNDCSHEPGCPESGSWFRSAHLQRYNLSVRGGSEAVSYFASGRWGEQEGVVAPQGMKEYTVRANVAFRPADNLEIQFNNMYARRDITWIPDGNNADGFLLNVLRGDRGYTPENDDSRVLEMDLLQEIDHYITGLQVNWSPIPSISQRLNVGLDYETSDLQDFKPWGYYAEPEGDREDDLQQDRNLTFDYAGTWTANVSGVQSNFSWGGQLYDEYSYQLNGFDARFAGPGDQLIGDGTLKDVAEGRTRIRSGGFFLQEVLGIGDRLFLTGGIRWDGFSTFGEGFGLAAYPKVSAAYTISDESFFPDRLGVLKLRGAWGQSGKAPAAFDAARIYEATSADEQQPAVIIANLGNPDLGPETTSELELGFEGSLIDGRILYDFTWYDQETDDALICVSEPPSLGTEECTLRNIGSVGSNGLEMSVNLGIVRSDNVDFELGGQYTKNESEVLDLGGLPDLGSSIQVGYPLFMYWNDIIQNPDAVGEQPVYERGFIGPRYPTDTYSISSRLTLWRRLTIDVLGEAQTGQYLENGTGYQNMRRSVWPTCTAIQERIDNDDLAGLTAADIGRCDPDHSDYGVWTEPADFFKLRSASIGYRLPDSLVPGAASATLRLQARNLFSITDYSGLDPEAEDGGAGQNFRNEYYNLPPARTFILNLTVNF